MVSEGPEVLNFGCRLNAAESASITQLCKDAGLRDIVVVNSCAVTSEAERQVRQGVRQLRRKRPSAQIFVTGCSARIHPEKWQQTPEIDGLIDNECKLDPEIYTEISAQAKGGTASKLISTFESGQQRDIKSAAGLTPGHVRAFLRAQTGCDHSCTFCIIPQGRGGSRSVDAETLVAQSRALVAKGAREIVLTGVDLTSWGQDLESRAGQVLKTGWLAKQILAEIPELPLLRLGSIDPAEIDEDMWDLIANEPRFAPHLHLSLQAGHDLILKRMKRRHSVAQAIDVCERARSLRAHIAFGADVIAGFPTETAEMFAATMRTVEQCGFVYLHVFPYSPREGTPAAHMPQIESATRRKRAADLRRLGHAALQKKLASHVGTVMSVCIETPQKGRTPCFAQVRLVDGAVGQTQQMKIVGFEGETLIADQTYSISGGA